MCNFVKLTRIDGDKPIWVNVDLVRNMDPKDRGPSRPGEVITILCHDEDDIVAVKETPEEIIALIAPRGN